MKHVYPLKLSYVPKERIWAGDTLASRWGKKAEGRSLGETWELSVRAEEMSLVQNGPLAGTSLGDLVATDPAILGKALPAEKFPLLVKLLDAGDTLSVQVHPDDDYAARIENDRGKTEMWYIVEAQQGAELILGLVPGVSREDFAVAVREGNFEHLLFRQPVRAGDCYFIPSGMPHAIGAGILIAEIQQNCDLTYRVYDFDRRDAQGKLRELHVDRALDVIRPFSQAEINAVRFSRTGGAVKKDLLADCEYFTVRERCVAGREEIPKGDRPRHWLCIEGRGEIRLGDEVYPLVRGDSYLLPVSLPPMTLCGELRVLESEF